MPVVAGLPVDDAGRLRVLDMGGYAPSTPNSSVAGLTVDLTANAVCVTSAAPGSTSYPVRGVAVRADGAVHVNAADAAQQVVGGVPVRTTGALCIANDSTPVNMVNGRYVVDADGKVVVTGYSAQAALAAVDYDGTNDYQTRGAELTNLTDSKTGTLSLWIRIDTLSVARLMASTNESPTRFQAITSAGATYQITATNAAGSTILDIATAMTFSAGASWIHLLSSWNLATAGARHIYVNDASSIVQTTFTNDTIDYTRGNWAIGGSTAGGTKFNGCMAEVFFHNTYIDLSVEANRRKFVSAALKPVYLGADGSRPLGVQPLIYAPNGDASTNAGSGGNFTTTGTLDACSSAPGS